VGRDSPFRWLLRLLPRTFRDDHERELVRVWQQELRDAAPHDRRRVWLRALIDTMRVAPREFAEAAGRNIGAAVRGLRRAPGFALAAILTLALGTGATAAVFTLINAVLLRPLPFAEPDRVGIVWPVPPSGDRTWLSFPELEELQRDLPGITAAAGLSDLRLTLLREGIGHEVQALAVSHETFAMLGVSPTRGRDFSAVDDRPGAAPVAILSDQLWRSRFLADAGMLGRTIRLNDRDYEVIGVMPPSFSLLPASTVMPQHIDVWLPLQPHLAGTDRTLRFLHVLARLRNGVSFAQANEQVRAFGARVTAEHPAVYRGGPWQFTVLPFAADVLKGARASLLLIFGLVLLVLLIACANVANLLLARADARRSDVALRSSLGASPARLAGELFAEAFVITGAGSVVGLTLALLIPPLLRMWDPSALPRLSTAGVDTTVLGFMTLVLVSCTVIVAAAPVVERRRLRSASLNLGSRSGGRSRGSARAARVLVVSQTALASTVLITTFALTIALIALHDVDLGFETDRRLTGRLALTPQAAAAIDPPQFFENVTAAIERVSGVANAAAITQLPLSGAMLGSTFLLEPGPDGRRIDADLRGITADYFSAIGTPLRRGRTFDARDTATGLPVAIVDETFASRMRADGDVIGRRIRWFRAPDVDIEIVGVVAAVRHRGPDESAKETVYRPHRQYPRTSMFLVADTTAEPASLIAPMHAAVAAVDATQPLADVRTLDDRLTVSVRRVRTSLLLAAMLAALALVLAIIGVYAVLSFGVAQRRREFGVRLTLGASPAGVRALVFKEGVLLIAIGVAAGMAGAIAISTLLRSVLHTGARHEPVAYAFGSAAIVAASIIAIWLPARRASVVDPVTVLRAD
jgi:predicted permease